MKGQCTKTFAPHFRPIPIPQYWQGVSGTCEIVIVFIFSCKISCKILFRNSAHLPLLLSVHVTTFLYAHAVYIHPKYLKKGSFGKSISRRSKTSLKYCCFSVSTINSMDGVLRSVIVSERLKMRKSLAINYWQDTISGVEVNSNVRNISNLWGVSTSF